MSWQLFGLLVQAAGYTIVISGISIAAGLVIGVGVMLAMLSPSRVLSIPAHLLPAIGIDVPSVVAAIVGLSLCTASYQAENLRGGFLMVPKGLIEAGDVAGLSALQRFLRIRAPLAIRLALPSLVNEAILILKASSLMSVVGVVELTRMAQDLAASTYLPLQLFAAAGLIYLIINLVVASCGALVERRFAVSLPGARA